MVYTCQYINYGINFVYVLGFLKDNTIIFRIKLLAVIVFVLQLVSDYKFIFPNYNKQWQYAKKNNNKLEIK